MGVSEKSKDSEPRKWYASDSKTLDSEYLCPICGRLVYIDVTTPQNNICVNKDCAKWPHDFNFIIDANETQAPGLYKEIQDEEKLITEEILNWKPGVIANYAYHARRELITSLLKGGVMPLIDHFIAIGELLLLVNKHSSKGTIDDLAKFRVLLEEVRRWNRHHRNLEDIRSGRVIFASTQPRLKPLLMKYAMVVIECQQGLGLVDENNLPGEGALFPYTQLEASVTPVLNLTGLKDGKDLLECFWLTSLQLRYWLQEHYRTKIQYNYEPHVLDFTVIFGWWLQTWNIDHPCIISRDKEEKEKADIQKHFDDFSGSNNSADRFFATYIDSTELVPIAIRTQDGLLMDYYTLFFFLIYLQGCPDPQGISFQTRGHLLVDMRGRVAGKFEMWLRDEIHKQGYLGPATAIKEKYDYDIIAISEEKRVILIADAKYRDIAPSSFTSKTLIAQEFLGPHGLEYESEREQLRLNYFRDNIEKFRCHLNPKQPWGEYEVRCFLVTKQIPLIHRYEEVKIFRAAEFLKSAI